MGRARKHFIAGQPDPDHLWRLEAMQEVYRDVFQLTETMTLPAKSVEEAARWIACGRELSSRILAIMGQDK